MYEFKLADLGEGMHEAEVVQWLIKVGDAVKLDQIIAKVETDKAVVELPAPVAGRVNEIRIQEGQTAKVGDVLVTLETMADVSVKPGTRNGNISVASASAVPMQKMTAGAALFSSSAPRRRVLAAPAVRKRAFELGIDIEQVRPSHPSGRVSLEDVQAYADSLKSAARTSQPVEVSSAPTPSPSVGFSPSSAQDERKPLTGLRKRIAEHMERSWRTIPHATAFDEVDGGALAALRHTLKPVAEQRGVRLTYMPLLIKLLIPVLKEFPIFNASFDEEKREVIYRGSYHIGVAADSPEGLLVPVLRDADRLSILDIAKQLEHLIQAAQKRTLTLPEVSGSTFTLNNVGSFGGSSGTPIINSPEVAILAVGRLQEKAVVHQGSIIARPMMPLALSFDHRLIDGAQAGKFLARFKHLVEHPHQILLDMI